MIRPVVALTLAAVTLGGCEIGTKEYEQIGYRGTGAQGVVDQSQRLALLKTVAAVPAPPYELTPDMLGGERAGAAYQNVQVLNNISTEQFNYLMAAMVTWIAPGEGAAQGCNYCHNAANYATDYYDNGKVIYTKIVARKMIQMNQNINGNWSNHVKPAGVTCWTCHRGNAVPVNKWAIEPNGDGLLQLKGNKRGGNTPLPETSYASLPVDPYSAFLREAREIRLAVPGNNSLNDGTNPQLTKNAEHTYSLMTHMSSGLGVNCSYCHNAGNFASWDLSRPQRAVAWYGIRMVRNINNAYIEPLAGVFPANRKGVLGDPYKVNCTTCHQGQAKPMNGYNMLKDYPGLKGPLGPMTVAKALPWYPVPPQVGRRERAVLVSNQGLPTAAQAHAASALIRPANMTSGDTAPVPSGRASGMPVSRTAPDGTVYQVYSEAPATVVAGAPVAIPAGAGALASTVAGQPRLNVYFDTGAAAIAPAFGQVSGNVVAALGTSPAAKLVVSGYNDPTGNAQANAALAKRRAQAVAAALRSAGVAEDRIVLEKPAETTLQGDNEAARRVEVSVRQ